MSKVTYTEENIRSLDWKEHIRMRPGMYIGKLGDGSAPDDGIYILLKEVVDNSIDEYFMGHGKAIDITVDDGQVSIRDYGRGIPLGKVVDCVSKINTGGKYDSKAFKKSVGLNGVGTKAVNALSEYFLVQAVRDGKAKAAEFERGEITKDHKVKKSAEPNGTLVVFRPDQDIFRKYRFRLDYMENQLWNYAYLNAGLKININGKTLVSKNGLLDLLERKASNENLRYPIIHMKGDDIEIALSHGNHYGEQYHSFVNGQNTTQGGTHLNALREAIVKTIQEHFNKSYDRRDILSSIVAAVSIRIEEPVFESQTKTKLGSTDMGPDGPTIRTFVVNFVKENLDNYLHKNPDITKALEKRIKQSERERKEIAGIKKLANQRAKKANLHNKKLRDCRLHFSDSARKVEEEFRKATTLFITEGDSASGSITKARDVQTQAVFSLRGKPLNCYGLTKKVVYENEEFNLLQHALNIEDGLDELRYNRVVIATDADVDGMHIRLLLLTFFLQFFPDLVRNGHLFILDTPLFRVRDKQQTFYCYSEEEKQRAIQKLRGKPEITRFKGLGEISPGEFKDFIGEDIRLEPVILNEDTDIDDVLAYYMGKNTPSRQEFIIDNLRVEKDEVEKEKEDTETEVAAVEEEMANA
ncbi:MAG: type IIA DNA topoisomerase subunit B [Phaeodactylibacter sp.]|nr:type IIA DNA topoisomerase subunit B [Phaeodactylibacter sp.]MCB9266242.1 type IIA DNA topoisomerase subunit B [Lewinellaceae bacterium]MCB9285997.1 type IIA DNA topoisomerase subunit B [Lewinellaceae bacterium]